MHGCCVVMLPPSRIGRGHAPLLCTRPVYVSRSGEAFTCTCVAIVVILYANKQGGGRATRNTWSWQQHPAREAACRSPALCPDDDMQAPRARQDRGHRQRVRPARSPLWYSPRYAHHLGLLSSRSHCVAEPLILGQELCNISHGELHHAASLLEVHLRRRPQLS